MSRTSRYYFYFKQLGLKKALIFLIGKYLNIKLNTHQQFLMFFTNKQGLEIGGPSNYFNTGNILPIYSVVDSLDGVNFSTSTIWEGTLSEGLTFKYDSTKVGYQYICDAVNLSLIHSCKYDFIISCNNLEHIANPLKAINEWLRVLKSDSLLLLVVPNNKINFDHKRKITTFKHLISDLEANIGENDLTHLDEILELHDLSLDPKAGCFSSFKDRSMDNHNNRALHHHVFDMNLLTELLAHFNVEILLKETTLTDHFILGCKRQINA